jgi:hypothetical protein
LRTAAAAIFRQEEHQLSKRVDIGMLDLIATVLFSSHQSGFCEHRKMGGEGALGYFKLAHDFACRTPSGFVSHEEPEGLEAGRIRERRQNG